MFGANNRLSLLGTQNSITSAFGTPGFGTAAVTGNTFGGLQPQQTQPSLFGSANTGFGVSTGSGLFGTQTSIFGTTPAVQQTTGFSATTPGSSNAFGSTTGLFGFTNSNDQSIFGANKFGSTVSPFGTTTQAAAPLGSTVQFNPVIGSDTMLKYGVNTNISTLQQCITCMKEYETKSLEELRLEDYQANRKGPGTSGNMFGTQGTSLFNSNPSSLSFNTSTNNSIFGANKPAFGATTQAAAPVGTTVKFSPFIGSDTMLKNGVDTKISTLHQYINCMKEYETKSVEELRLEDYQANRKGPGTTVNMFGTQGTSLFNSNPSSLSVNTSTNNSTFGANAFAFRATTQASAPVDTSFKFNPFIGSDTMLKNGVNTNISTLHQHISCMKEYETKSVEELRLEDYQANRKGPGTTGNMFGTQGTSLFNSNPSSLSVNTLANNTMFRANKFAFGATTNASNTSIYINLDISLCFMNNTS